MPRISVIIPLYNSEKTIEETIQSALKQTINDFEIIIINDGSSDSSLEKVENINDKRIHVFSYENSGASVSRNRGFSHSSGELIAFLDADDQWTPDKLESQMMALDNTPEAAIAYSWTEFIDESDQFIVRGKAVTVRTKEETYERLLVSNFLDSGSNPLIRRAAFEAVGGFDESLQGCQDIDLYLRLAKHYAFITVPKYQIKYRISATSMTANTRKWEKSALHFLDIAFAVAPKSLQHLKIKRLTQLYRHLMLRRLEGKPTSQNSWMAIVYLFKMLHYSPILAKQQSKFLTIVLLKSLIGLVLPSVIAAALIERLTGRRRQAL